MDRRNLTAALASIVFFALACIYFIPAANLREIQNHRASGGIDTGRRSLDPMADDAGDGILAGWRFHGSIRVLHRADGFLRACPYNADNLACRKAAARRKDMQGGCNRRCGSRGVPRHICIDLHHPARTSRRHPHRMRGLCHSDLLDVWTGLVAEKPHPGGRCRTFPAFGHDPVMEQIRKSGGEQPLADNGAILCRADSALDGCVQGA